MVTNKATPRRTWISLARGVRLLLAPRNRGGAMAGAVVIAAVAGLLYSWEQWGKLATGAPEYLVTPERIEITPLPAWIHSDVKAEVVRSIAAARLDLGDRKLVERIAHAFALHPWVAQVVRVEKRFPARVRVELVYRRPVAVVEVSDRGESGLLFIDEQSVLLPSADFAPNQAKAYLRIASGQETPAGYGLPWRSDRIAGAARLAAAWGDQWQPLGLYRIIARQVADGQWEYELRTKHDARVIWGDPPGKESAREPSAEQKIAALKRHVRDKGPLDSTNAPSTIDLRELARAPAKTAARPRDGKH